ncbi:hypothetical protein KKH23_07860, partial [Patescibacteria group bacterium]|nr:hypothetical protein [Patescibacteria group bacterium]
NEAIGGLDSLDSKILDRHPILKYRVNNFRNNRNVRGIKEDDSQLCYLVLDDMAIAGDYHFPCIIYMREGGDPIGRVSPKMRVERYKWFMNHETHRDPICRENCLDVCIDHNNRVQGLQRLPERLDGSNLDWQAWRHGTPMELGLRCRYYSLCSVEGKRIIREKCIGWCPGEETLARPKRNQTGIAFFHNDEKFWFHIRNHEFKEIFPELT